MLKALIKELGNATHYVDGKDVAYEYRKFTIPVIEFNEAVAIIKKHYRKHKKQHESKRRQTK